MLRHLVIINSPQQNYWGSKNLGACGMMWLAGQLGPDWVLSFLLETWCNYSSCLWPVWCWRLDEVIRILPLAVKSINLALHCTGLRHTEIQYLSTSWKLSCQRGRNRRNEVSRVSLQIFPLKLLERSSQVREAGLCFGGSVTRLGRSGPLSWGALQTCLARDGQLRGTWALGVPMLTEGAASLFKGDGKGKSGGRGGACYFIL